MTPLAADAGYVAAAYGVFVGLVVVYAVILAARVRRARRELRDLEARAAEMRDEAEREAELEAAAR